VTQKDQIFKKNYQVHFSNNDSNKAKIEKNRMVPTFKENGRICSEEASSPFSQRAHTYASKHLAPLTDQGSSESCGLHACRYTKSMLLCLQEILILLLKVLMILFDDRVVVHNCDSVIGEKST
jgi:hypothetical protein